MAKILIVGLGDIGSRLAITLRDQGHEVHGLRRSTSALPGIRTHQADVTQPATLVLPMGLDYVYIILTPGESSDEGYRRIFIEGLGNVLAALQGQAIKRIFFVSSTAVYAQDQGEWVDESSPTEPTAYNGIRLLEAERLLRASAFTSTTVRFAGIYGPGRLRLINWVKSGKPVVAEPPQWTNRIHSDDCVGLLAFLLAKDAEGVALEEIYIGVDDEPVPLHVVLDWIADKLSTEHAVRINTPTIGRGKRIRSSSVLILLYQRNFQNFRHGYGNMISRI
jgi:nucleoside-diphosphate-sugar epimerase